MQTGVADLDEIRNFLGCRTDNRWLERALEQLEVLLVDHAQCEQKAAAAAMRLMYRYADDAELVLRMAKLAREELRHFEQVVQLMSRRGLAYRRQSPSRYAAGLQALVRGGEPFAGTDLLIIGAFIEARSCERFAALVPLLDSELAAFYAGLLASEARHYRHYLALARKRAVNEDDWLRRIDVVRIREAELIDSPDPQFRFHSGLPC